MAISKYIKEVKLGVKKITVAQTALVSYDAGGW
jgi:hypothetical protein